jgi:hypothetical protein
VSGQDGAVADFLVVSLVLSVALTIVLNVALRVFPGAGRRVGDLVDRSLERAQRDGRDRRGVRVIVPWRLMIIVSIALTILLNVVLAMQR